MCVSTLYWADIALFDIERAGELGLADFSPGHLYAFAYFFIVSVNVIWLVIFFMFFS